MILEDEEAARSYVATLCDAASFARLERLAGLLVEENARQNLIARGSVAQMWQRHIADSAQLLRFVSRETIDHPWIDLGSGAGFPGLVLAIMRPEWRFCLVESRRRRIEWLQQCVTELELHRCDVLGDRLERIATFPASVISARAFAPLDALLGLAERFSTEDSLWLLPKGRGAGVELAQLPRKKAAMFHVEHSLTDPDAGIIVGQLAGDARSEAKTGRKKAES